MAFPWLSTRETEESRLENRVHFLPWEENSSKTVISALTGVAQWVEGHPVNQQAAGSIPSQGTRLGYRPGPQMGACERQPVNVSLAHRCFFPSPSPSLPLSLKISKIFRKKKKEKPVVSVMCIRLCTKSPGQYSGGQK